MGNYLAPSSDGFEESLNSEIYVDKTPLLGLLNPRIKTRKKFVCISRPRRFGKSVTADMLCAYYGQGRDSSYLFDDLLIARDPSYRKHLNAYNVVFINMTDEYNRADRDVEMLKSKLTGRIVSELMSVYSDIALSAPDDLSLSMADVYAVTKVPFIVVIDEWDCILRENRQDTAGFELYLEWLKTLFKDKPYIGLAYMTGILPIKKYGSYGALNMFDEYSMVDPKKFAPFIGFTEDEVMDLCRKYSIDALSMKQWYDGYSFKNVPHVFNPNSVVNAILEQDFSSYWTKTETYEALQRYIDLDMDGLRQDIVDLLSGRFVYVDVDKFTNDMVTFVSKNDVLTLLIHLGYLAFDPEAPDKAGMQAVRIPDQEIRREFFSTMRDDNRYEEIHGLLADTEDLLNCIWDRQDDKVAEILDRAHVDDTSILNYNDENSLSCVVALAMHLSINYYKAYRELPAGKGFADMVYLPKESVHKPALLIELKYDKAADSAIRQIHEKRYTDFFKDYRGEVLLVGINYDKTTKRHDCLIEKFVR